MYRRITDDVVRQNLTIVYHVTYQYQVSIADSFINDMETKI